jgi:rare lipoprotein A
MKRLFSFVAALSCALVIGGHLEASASSRQEGTASFYRHGKRTANGERFNPRGLTAAHRSLPFGTRVKVTHRKNGKSVIVRINDRGPFAKRRIIDLSHGAAQQLGMLNSGVAPVIVEVVN